MSLSNKDARRLDEYAATAAAAYKAMTPVDRALHDADQRRSFIRGQAGFEPPSDVLADEVRRLRADLEASHAALQAAEAQVVGLVEIIDMVLRCDREALANHRPKGGIADCVDNSGTPYQSQYLADALADARTALAELNPPPPGGVSR